MAIALLIAASDRFDWLVFGVFECNRLVQHERKIVAFLNAEEHGGKRSEKCGLGGFPHEQLFKTE